MLTMSKCPSCQDGRTCDVRFRALRFRACVRCGGLGQVSAEPDFVQRTNRLRQYWEAYEPQDMPHPQLSGVRCQALLAYLRELQGLCQRYGGSQSSYAKQLSHSHQLLAQASRLQQASREQAAHLRAAQFLVDPDLVEPLRLAMVEAVLGNLDEAENIYTSVLDKYGQYADLRHSYGFFLANFRERPGDALPHLILACQLAPTADHLLNTAKCFYRLDNQIEAYKYLEATVAADDFSRLEMSEQVAVQDELRRYAEQWTSAN